MSDIDNLSWFGHASFSIENKIGKKFYFVDPFDLKRTPNEKADAIFVTHAHHDHWSPTDIRKILKPDTAVIATNGCQNLNLSNNAFIIVEPGRVMTVAGIRIKTIPAYNFKPDRLNYHPKENKWVGYVLEVGETRIYHAGDTDFIPEMKTLTDIDVAMLPVGGTYVMDVKEAIQAANAINAKVAVPMHYRMLLKDRAKAAEEEFKSGVKGKVEILRELS